MKQQVIFYAFLLSLLCKLKFAADMALPIDALYFLLVRYVACYKPKFNFGFLIQDFIKRGPYKISPKDLEGVLYQHPGIKDAVVRI